MTGLQSAGVAACAKHFPGHGSTRTDTHEVLAAITGGMAELRQRDLPPFQAAIAAGTAAVMPGHLRLPELTGDLPASLSAAAMTGLLRGELGFTRRDHLGRAGDARGQHPFGIPEAAVLAVTAGVDLLCLGRDTSEEVYHAVVAALADAVRTGRLPGQPLEDAADRVAALRSWLASARASRRAAGDGGQAVTGQNGTDIGLQRGAAGGPAVRCAAGPDGPGDRRDRTAAERRGGARRVGPGPLGAAGGSAIAAPRPGPIRRESGLVPTLGRASRRARTPARAASRPRSSWSWVRTPPPDARDLVRPCSPTAGRRGGRDGPAGRRGREADWAYGASQRAAVAEPGGQPAAEPAAFGFAGQLAALLEGTAARLGRQAPDGVAAHQVEAADMDDRRARARLVWGAALRVAAHERKAADLHVHGAGQVDGRAAHDREHVHGKAVGVDLGVAQVDLVPSHDRHRVDHRGGPQPPAPL